VTQKHNYKLTNYKNKQKKKTTKITNHKLTVGGTSGVIDQPFDKITPSSETVKLMVSSLN